MRESSILNDAFFGRLETLALNLRSNLNGYFGGKHLVKTYGQTVEFADYREYMLGDDIRRIDWNLFSRFGKYFLKLFTDERQMQVQIFVDMSGSMGKDNKQKADYALATAAALGYLAVHNMDKVTFNFMKGDRSENPFGTIVGKTAFFSAIGAFDSLEFDNDNDIEACVKNCPDTGNRNGLTVIVSDFFTESNWKKAVDYLCYKNRQVILIQVMSPDEADPSYNGRVALIDSESLDVADTRNMKINITRSLREAYEEALAEFLEDMKSYCHRRGADFISVTSDQPIERVLFGELFKVGIMS